MLTAQGIKEPRGVSISSLDALGPASESLLSRADRLSFEPCTSTCANSNVSEARQLVSGVVWDAVLSAQLARVCSDCLLEYAQMAPGICPQSPCAGLRLSAVGMRGSFNWFHHGRLRYNVG